MKRTEIPYKDLKELADSLPKIESGLKKLKLSKKGYQISKEQWKKIGGNGFKNANETYNWIEYTQLYVNHYERLIKIFSAKGQPGIEEYTIKMKEANITNAMKRALK